MTSLHACRNRHLTVIVLISQLLPAPALAQGIPRESGAAGGPIDAIDCTGAQTVVTRLTTNLPNQDALIAKLEAQVAQSRQSANAADESVNQQLLDAAKNEFTGAVKDYLKTTDQMKKLADALTKRGLGPAQQEKLLDAVEEAKSSEALWKSFKAGQQTGREFLASERKMWDDVARVNKLFVDSGIADQAFDGLVDALMKTPATAPAAILAKVARLSIDVGATMAGGMIDAEDARKANETLDVLRAQRNKFKDKIADLTAKCLQPKRTTENKGDPNASPAAPPKAGGAGKAVVGILAGVGAAAAGAYAYSAYQESQELMNEFANLSTNTSSGSSSNPPQTTGASAFNGTYRAQVTRSCVAGGFPASCCGIL